MKKCAKERVYLLLLFFLLFNECPMVTNGYRITSEKKRLWTRRDQNIGTVLFDKSDIERECWSNEDLTLLNSRIIFQDILPQVDLIDVHNDEYIGLLMDYIDVCLEVVQKLTTGKTKRLLLKALADTIAGYLRVYILPLTRRSYYAGNIKYRKAKRLFDLYEELKVFLRSNGIGWLKPIMQGHFEPPTPLVISPGESVYSSEYSRRARQSRHSGPCSSLILYPGKEGGFLVPMPFLDDDDKPNSIAFPFEDESLHSLYSPKSAFILVKYYATGVDCILHSSGKNELDAFQKQLNYWLQRVVRRHLDDEKWYPAFGGVLRVTASLQATGTGPEFPKHDPHQGQPEVLTEPKNPGGTTENNGEAAAGLDTKDIIIIVAVVILVIWLLLGMCVVCYRWHAKRLEEYRNTPIAVLYKNIDYSSPDYSAPLERGFFRRFPYSWRKKVPPPAQCTCSDEDEDEDDEERCLVSVCYQTAQPDQFEEEKKHPKFTSAPSFAVTTGECHTYGKPCYTFDETTSATDIQTPAS